MAIYALEGLAPEWFTPDGQEEDDLKTRFELKPLDVEQFSTLHLMIKDGYFTGESVSYALKHGLTNWDHFKTQAGDLAYSEFNKKQISGSLRIVLANKIYEKSILSEAQIKN